MSNKKKCLLCGAENDHNATHCHLCGHSEFEDIIEETPPDSESEEESASEGDQEPHVLAENPFGDYVDPGHIGGDIDPTEGDPAELESADEADPPFCSYLKDNNEMCRAKKPSPCGRHDSDKQIQQEAKLKEVIVEAFNKTQGASYSVSSLGLPDEASAFEFLCAVFYYLDVNQDRMNYSPYIGLPLTIENEHDHRREDNWILHTYDYSYTCRYCNAERPRGQTAADATPVSASSSGSPQAVNYITNHSKLIAESTGLKADGNSADHEYPACFIEGLWDHTWVMRDKGRVCLHCGTGFTLNPNRDR